MGSAKLVFAAFCALTFFSGHVNCARVLGFFPYSGYSHFVVFQALMEELAIKGHDVTVLSYFPHKNAPARYKDISLEGLQEIRKHIITFEDMDSAVPSFLKPYYVFFELSRYGMKDCETILPSKQAQIVMESKGKYDIVVMEQFSTDCFLPVVGKLQVPVVAISSCGAMPWSYRQYGNPMDPAYIPNIMTSNSPKMNLIQRTLNMIFNFLTSFGYDIFFNRPAEILVDKYLGQKVNLNEMAKNISMVLINSHYSLLLPRPHLPGIVEIGGIHVKPLKPLPNDLEEFVSSATDGVIVFSLGSMLDIKSMPKEKLLAFLNVFATLPQRIVWKIDMQFENLPDNVLTISWLPQRDILAHKNVKAFIAHGGLLGLIEAITGGKPVVGIPIFGDQPFNIQAAVDLGLAVKLDYLDICEETVRKSIETVLSDKYQIRAKELSYIFQDRQNSPKETAVYWIEYVLRHGGGPLRSTSADLTWIEYYMIDALLLTITFIIAVFYIFWKVIKLIFSTTKHKKD